MLTDARGYGSHVRGHPSPGREPHKGQEHIMSPHKRDAKQHAKARRRRYLKAHERLQRDRRQAQHAAAALHPRRFITTQTLRRFARPCADTCSAHHRLETSGAGTARAAEARSRLAGLAWSGAPFGGCRPQTPTRPQRSVVRLVFYWPGCVPRIGTLWKASHGRGGLAGGRSLGAAPLACFWPLRFSCLEATQGTRRSLLRQGPRCALPSAAGSPP